MNHKSVFESLGNFIGVGLVVLGAPTASILSLNTLGVTNIPISLSVVASAAWVATAPLLYIAWIKRL